ncbi:neurotransmitter-gated ion-channel ligand binding domain-containing protein [Ditylenchus destructor]|uniref:Neurotransmitter-gated ion-channel ligand binding domain-containing protein n=1 Tax=Ditylenchus destructor TaxID=166010 RepID=A0AAD4MUE3_9BILA|nr:neurotransmitter-gated ion-channel ligand binding domain-containing protein [Ditylenchus destructor]
MNKISVILSSGALKLTSTEDLNSNSSPSQSFSASGSSSAVSSQFSATSCVDSDPKCALWAGQGECQSNAVWMMSNCRRSCQSCQGGDRAWQLRNQLAKNYDNATANPNSTITRMVKIESVRLNHIEIDEAKQLVRLFGRMVLSWNDSKVTWSKEEWGISWLNFYWIQVWTPQLIQINAPSSSPGIVTGKVLAANYTGQVYMWTDFNFVAPYHFQYDSYPNDRQRICYKFDDKRYFSVRFFVSDEVHSRKHEAMSETHVAGWQVEDMEVNDSKYVIQMLGDWKQNPFDIQTNNCELCISLKRNAVYYVSEMLCPALVTSLITLSATLFQLSTIQPLVLAFSLVAQIMAMSLINTRLPAYTDATPTILKYAGFNLTCTGLLFLITLALRKLAQANSNIPLPRTLYAVLSVVDKLLPFPRATGKDAEDSSMGYYSDVAHTLNHLVFAIFFLVYSVNIVFSFVF